MKNNGQKRRKNNAVICATAVVSVLAFVITFAGNRLSPVWDQIYTVFGLKSSSPKDADFVEFLDVGQGDSILIYSNGYSAIIDTGTSECGARITSALNDAGVRDIDVLIETHLHSDHIGGAEYVLNIFDVKNLILPDLNLNSEGLPAAKVAKRMVVDSSGAVYTAAPGMNMNIGDFEITVIAYYEDMSNENDSSIVTVAKIGDIKFLLMGDAEKAAESRILADNINVECDVIKVGHHGSSTSSSEEFLNAAKPEYAVISVGEHNTYSHPSPDTLSTLEKVGAEIYRTDKSGNITFEVKNGNLKVTTEK